MVKYNIINRNFIIRVRPYPFGNKSVMTTAKKLSEQIGKDKADEYFKKAMNSPKKKLSFSKHKTHLVEMYSRSYMYSD